MHVYLAHLCWSWWSFAPVPLFDLKCYYKLFSLMRPRSQFLKASTHINKNWNNSCQCDAVNNPMPLITTYSTTYNNLLKDPGFRIQGTSWETPGVQVCGHPSEDGLTQVLLTLRIPLKQINGYVKCDKSTSNSVPTLLMWLTLGKPF